jgi:hypothetical protein
MNYCRQCHTYFFNGDACNCPPAGPVAEGNNGSTGVGGSTEAATNAERRRIPYPTGEDAVRTGLFD